MDELQRIVSDARYSGIEHVLQLLRQLPGSATLPFLFSRPYSLGGRTVLDALAAGDPEKVLATAAAFTEGGLTAIRFFSAPAARPRQPILFLDFDGVLHRPLSCKAMPDLVQGYAGRPWVRGPKFEWTGHLEELLEEFPRVLLVTHSSWRQLWTDDELRAMMPPALASHFLGATDRQIASRSESIAAWCKEHGVQRFVVLDDNPDEFQPDQPHLVVPDGLKGLSSPQSVLALREALADIADTGSSERASPE